MAAMLTIGQSRTLLIVTVLSTIVVDAQTGQVGILLVASLTNATMLARIAVVNAVLVLAERSVRALLANASRLMVGSRAIYALAIVFAFVRRAHFQLTVVARVTMTTYALGFR